MTIEGVEGASSDSGQKQDKSAEEKAPEEQAAEKECRKLDFNNCAQQEEMINKLQFLQGDKFNLEASKNMSKTSLEDQINEEEAINPATSFTSNY